jgi:hypothetical protein
MKPPMGNMYSFCSHFARASEAIDFQWLSAACSKFVPPVPHGGNPAGQIGIHWLDHGLSIRFQTAAEART